MPGGVLQAPMEQVGPAESDAHCQRDGVVLIHSVISHEVGNERPSHAVAAPAVKEDRCRRGIAKDREDSFHRAVVEGRA